MRSIIFKGKFSHLKENINQGTIVLCHFEPEDNDKIIFQAAKKYTQTANDRLILVPFAHLFEKSASKKEAKRLFEVLVNFCIEFKMQTVTVVPFGVKKEFFLYAPADNSAIKFMKF